MKRDMTPVIGLISGIILIIWAIASSGDIINFIDISSVVITIFGSLCALIISFPLDILKKLPSLFKVLTSDNLDQRADLISRFINLSKKARKDGLLALEDDIYDIDNEVLKTGLQLVVDGVEPEMIRDILELKLNGIENRHRRGQALFLQWGNLAPAFGMLGTLIGLIVMLSELDDPDSIGQGMATALVTTFYGSFLANMIFLPIANNLKIKTDEEMITGEMVVDGILEIQAGSNPRIIEEKLITYLAPVDQRDFKQLKDTGEADNYEQT